MEIGFLPTLGSGDASRLGFHLAKPPCCFTQVLYEDAKARFPGFKYSEEILTAEAERYIELGKRLDPYITDTVGLHLGSLYFSAGFGHFGDGNFAS